MLRLTLALSSLAATVAALSEGTSELQNSLRLQANPTWLKSQYYQGTGTGNDATCSGTPLSITGEAVGVCRVMSIAPDSSQMLEYVSDTEFAVKTFSGVTDCSGTGSTGSTISFTGGAVCNVAPYNTKCCTDQFDVSQMVIYSWEYSQPMFVGGGIENYYSTANACSAKTGTDIAASYSYPGLSFCDPDGSTYDLHVYSADQLSWSTGYTSDNCTSSSASEVTCKSCDSSNAQCLSSLNSLNAYTSYGVGVAPAPAASGDDDDDVCFSGGETLLLETGSVIAMDSVEIGDRVQVASASDGSLSFADVIFLPHKRNDKLSNFIEIQTATASLRATPSHLVMAGSCGANEMVLTRVEDISVGDCMDSVSGEDVVIASEKSLGRGVYSVVTSHADGIIVVNGFKASSFAVSHVVVNNYYQIHRTIYAHFPAVIKALAVLGQLLGSIGACIISA